MYVVGIVGGNGVKSGGLYVGVVFGVDIIGYGLGVGLFILDMIGGFDYVLIY